MCLIMLTPKSGCEDKMAEYLDCRLRTWASPVLSLCIPWHSGWHRTVVILWETEGKGEQENEDYPKSRPLAGKRILALIKCLMKVWADDNRAKTVGFGHWCYFLRMTLAGCGDVGGRFQVVRKEWVGRKWKAEGVITFSFRKEREELGQ